MNVSLRVVDVAMRVADVDERLAHVAVLAGDDRDRSTVFDEPFGGVYESVGELDER